MSIILTQTDSEASNYHSSQNMDTNENKQLRNRRVSWNEEDEGPPRGKTKLAWFSSMLKRNSFQKNSVVPVSENDKVRIFSNRSLNNSDRIPYSPDHHRLQTVAENNQYPSNNFVNDKDSSLVDITQSAVALVGKGNKSNGKESEGEVSPIRRAKEIAHIESKGFQFYFTIPLTIVGIFLYDSWIISNPPDSMNSAMDGALFTISFLFICEMLYYFYYEPSYRMSFYLVMDLAACASLILDVSFVSNMFTNPRAAAYLGEAMVGKLFARYGRIMRVVKLFRHFTKFLLSLPSVLLSNSKSSSSSAYNENLHNISSLSMKSVSSSRSVHPIENNHSESTMGVHSQFETISTKKQHHNAHVYVISKASYELSRRLMERLAMMITVIACIAPYLVYTTSSAVSVNAWMENFKQLSSSSLALNNTNFQAAANDMHRFYKTEDIHVLDIFMSGPNPALINNSFTSVYPPSRSVIRAANKGYYTLDYTVNGIPYDIKVTMDQTYPTQMLSVYFISLALLMIVVLSYFAFSFPPLLNTYLVIPLTKMVISLKESANEIMKNVEAMSKHFGSIQDEEEDDEDVFEYDHRASISDDEGGSSSLHNVDSQELFEGSQDLESSQDLKSCSSKSYLSRVKFHLNNNSKSLSKIVGIVNKVTLKSSKSSSVAKSALKRNSRSFTFGSDDDSEEAYDEFYSNKGSNEVDMTQKMTKMVAKLSKLVQNMLPSGGNIDLDNTHNIDQATKTWLHANYNHSNNTKNITSIRRNSSMDLEAERKRLQLLAESQTAVSLELLNSWNFDVLCYSDTQLCEVLTYLFSVHNFFVDFKVPDGSFLSFVMQLCDLYSTDNPYHNFKHGCDVCHTTHRYLSITRIDTDQFSKLEIFSVLVAALSHDVGHPGVNNIFLVKAKAELALRHNDQSPLENMHCSLLYEILGKKESNIFAGLTEAQWRESRKIILTTILGTDMVHHFEQINKAQVFCEVNGKDVHSFCKGESTHIECFSQDANRLFLLELFLHSADISNPNKPWAICEKWSVLIAEEFARQGDREKTEGLEVSPMMDREKIVLCNMQLGFIEFVVTPLAIAMINIFPSLFEIGIFMQDNFTNWCNKRKQEILDSTTELSKEEEVGKLYDRMTKYNEKMAFVHNYELVEQHQLVGSIKVRQTVVAVNKRRRQPSCATVDGGSTIKHDSGSNVRKQRNSISRLVTEFGNATD